MKADYRRIHFILRNENRTLLSFELILRNRPERGSTFVPAVSGVLRVIRIRSARQELTQKNRGISGRPHSSAPRVTLLPSSGIEARLAQFWETL